MDDEPMWATDHVVAPTPSSAVTILETANEFAIKGNHLTLVKGNQFDGRTKTDPQKHIHEFFRICDMFKYRDTKNEVVRLMMFPLSLTGEAKTCEINQEVINATASGIFLYKTPNQAYQLFEDTVILKLDWVKNQKTKSSLKKTIDFTNEGNSNFDTDKIMAQMDAMTLKMDAQYKELHSNAKKTKLDLNNDDTPMSREEEAKFMQTFHTSIIYPISNNPWVNPIHYVPKKVGIKVVTNENDELVPTRTVTGWRVCIDYRKHNEATAKDRFLLPFIDQMLKRLAGNKYFCFLDGFSGYFQIPIGPNDQEKTIFTCPFGTYAYRRMPFGLCNAPAIFQRCMLAIFYYMIEESVEVFMDDFSVFVNSFDSCLNNLDKMLQRCRDAHLVLNWEKCHFMIKEGIVLGHNVSNAGLEVDKEKVDVISKLPSPTNIKALRHLFKKQNAMSYSILLLQEFDKEIKDRKETENVAIDHLSRIENDKSSDDSEVGDNFPGEALMEINTKDEPWFADFANYLVGDVILKGIMYQQKKFFSLTSNTTFGKNIIFSRYALTI
nr:reverse transcriptase domain-containing protein [Tanacetum cinerariifolium]